ncbi:hypothetical protein RFI_10515, partial [Reticulomyxa filosa]
MDTTTITAADPSHIDNINPNVTSIGNKYSSIPSAMVLVDMYANRPMRLPDHIWKKLNDIYLYKRKQRKRMDPFEIIIYWLLNRTNECAGDAEVDRLRISAVMETIEDFIWFKLSILFDDLNPLPEWLVPRSRARSLLPHEQKDSNDSISSLLHASNAGTTSKAALARNRYMPCSLPALQELIVDEGPSIAKQSNNPFLYPLWLLQTQQFELAVNSLWPDHPLEAVHLGLGLRYYGLLNVLQDSVQGKVAPLEDIVQTVALHLSPSFPAYCFWYLQMLDDQYMAPYYRQKNEEKKKHKRKHKHRSSLQALESGMDVDADAGIVDIDVVNVDVDADMDADLDLDLDLESEIGKELDTNKYVQMNKGCQVLMDILAQTSPISTVSLYLGTVNINDVVRVNGLIYQCSGDIRARTVAKQAAKVAFAQGNEERAILLLILAGAYQKAAELLLKLLGGHLNQKANHPRKRVIVDLTKKLIF